MSASRAVMRALRGLWPRSQPQPVVRIVRDEPARMRDSQLLRDKHVLVTGAGQNIGRSIALEMAVQGATVYFTDLEPDVVDRLQRELDEIGARARGFVSDVSRPADIDALGATLAADAIVVDVLVNNAGVVRGRGLRTLAMADLRAVFETNVFGPLQLTQHVVNSLISAGRPGSILFVTSVHEWRTFGPVAYSASKAALGMVIKELAFELAPHGIRVNGIAPGGVRASAEDELRSFSGSPLFGTHIHPTYIGRAAVYLAADHFSQFTTGSVLTVDAGFLARP